jgi:hypothetical protein
MKAEKMYRCCWKMASDLLQGLERRDLTLIEKQLKPLRETLAARHCLSETAFDAGPWLWLEQLDLLEGITESVQASVQAIRRSSQAHLLHMETAESLLRHLVIGDFAGRYSKLPVC